MTTYFVSNAGSNTSPYDTEAKAANALSTVIAIPVAATDVVKVSSTHTENSGAAITYTLPTTIGLQVLSVTFNGSGTGGVAAGAAITTGGNNALAMTGYGYFYGINFTVGAGGNSSGAQFNLATTAQAHGVVYDTCSFYTNTTNTGVVFNAGIGANNADRDFLASFRNTQFRFASTSHKFTLKQGAYVFSGVTFHVLTSVPTTLFTFNTAVVTLLDISASDFAILTNTTMFDIGVNAPSRIMIKECLLPSGFTLTTGTPLGGPGAAELIMVDCDSGDNHYKFVKSTYAGTVTQQNSIYADASNGTDNLGWTLAATANATFLAPLVCPPISYWNATLSAMTTTVEAASNNVTFKDNELWQETLSKVTTGSPIGTWNVTDRAADVLAAGANQTTSTKTWTGVPGTPVLQKLVTSSFTPAEVGVIRVRTFLGKASATAYISPRVL